MKADVHKIKNLAIILTLLILTYGIWQMISAKSFNLSKDNSFNISKDDINICMPTYNVVLFGKDNIKDGINKEIGLIKYFNIKNKSENCDFLRESLIIPAYTSKRDMGNSFIWENRMDLVSNEHGYLYKKSNHMPFQISSNIKPEIIEKSNDLYHIKYTAYGNFKPYEGKKGTLSYNGWWSTEYWFYPTYFDYQVSFNFKEDINVEYIKLFGFHLNENIFTDWYVSPTINGKYGIKKKPIGGIGVAGNDYLGHFDNPDMGFAAYYGNDFIITSYLKETSDPLDYMIYDPYLNTGGHPIGALNIGWSGQHAMSVKDDIYGTVSPNHYTTYGKNRIHNWKFRIIPLDTRNPKIQLDNMYNNITMNEYQLLIDGHYDNNLSVNINGVKITPSQIKNGTFYTSKLFNDKNGSWQNKLVVNNPSSKTYDINITIKKYNTTIVSLPNLDIRPKDSFSYLFDLWLLGKKTKINYWLWTTAENIYDEQYIIKVNNKSIAILAPKKESFKNRDWVNDYIIHGQNLIELSGSNISKKVSHAEIIKYYYDKENETIPIETYIPNNDHIIGKFYIK